MSKRSEIRDQVQELIWSSENSKQLREELHKAFPKASFIVAFKFSPFMAFVWIPTKFFF